MKIETAKHIIWHAIAIAIWVAVCVVYGIWLYGWYADTSIQASWIIHTAVWIVAVELLSAVLNAGMGMAGYEKQWVKKDV